MKTVLKRPIAEFGAYTLAQVDMAGDAAGAKYIYELSAIRFSLIPDMPCSDKGSTGKCAPGGARLQD